MARRYSAAMALAMRNILAGMTPYQAARSAQVALSTVYRSELYKLWRDGHKDELRREMDLTTPRPRVKTKKPSKKLTD